MTINSILNEATDFSTGQGVIDSIKNGEAGVSANKFFSVNVEGEDGKYHPTKDGFNNKAAEPYIVKAKYMFQIIIADCKSFNLDRTKVIKLILKRSENITHFLFVHKNLDPYVAYFKMVIPSSASSFRLISSPPA